MPRLARAAALAALLAPAAAAQAPAGDARPTLVVFITIDQMRPDYFTRFGPQLTGGLRRLYDGSAVFTEGATTTRSPRPPRGTRW
jgi:predicted AlkP superfamily pyrophosphatase or phosphodiesterase